MKLITHYIFSAGVLSLALAPLTYYHLPIAVAVSVIANTVIDRLGHEIRGGIPVRTPLTHTLPRSVIWGLVSSSPLFVLYFYHYYYWYEVIRHIVPIAVAGVLVGPTHMVLDVVTERGIYVKKNGRWRRFALAHFRYNNPAVNGLAAVAGVIMLFLSTSPELLYYHYYFLLSTHL